MVGLADGEVYHYSLSQTTATTGFLILMGRIWATKSIIIVSIES
jgi:hypothetical protein